MTATLLVEIGCEEIPARMTRGAAEDLAARLVAILDQAALEHGAAVAWWGTRRIAVRVAAVAARQADRDEQVLGPPAKAGIDAAGALTAAALGFARKQGVDPGILRPIATERGDYVGFERRVAGRGVGEVLAAALPAAVEGMAFPKTMRWGDGTHRWVRPVHWVVALHGETCLSIRLLGIESGRKSAGHRFLHADGDIELGDADRYAETLRRAFVVADPAERRATLAAALEARAAAAGGAVVHDAALLDEIADLVEWPGVVEGRFDATFLDLPREILVTTLRHHQKCFCVERDGQLLPVFLGVANTDRDPAGHIRRGNEWVATGRLQDAQFFWRQDRAVALAGRSERMRSVVFHARAGTYADKADRVAAISAALAPRVDLGAPEAQAAVEAARLAKNDLSTGLVGEFPELQGIVGGLLLRSEGVDAPVAQAVYEHYLPAAADDPLPASPAGAVVSVADKLDTVGSLLRAGETPSGSRDPFGLRRAANAVFRIIEARGWPLSLEDLGQLAGGGEVVQGFLADRYPGHLRELGFTSNEVLAVLRPRVERSGSSGWRLGDVLARLDAIRTVRGRKDFEHLVDLTKRVDNILLKGADGIRGAAGSAAWSETEPAALALAELLDAWAPRAATRAAAGDYRETVDIIARFIGPVETFFDQVLVLDPKNPAATAGRARLLGERLRPLLVSYFDLRELAGQADAGR